MNLSCAWLGPGILLLGLSSLCAVAGQTTLAEWAFAQSNSLQQWRPNEALAGLAPTKDGLACRATGADPFLTLCSPLAIETSSAQWLEIRLKADRDGVAQLFWTGDTNGLYGGFSEAKSTRFNVRGDKAWHTYCLLPGWQNEGKIVRLRFDLYDAARFELGRLRICQFDTPREARDEVWSLEQPPGEWPWLEPLSGKDTVSVVRTGRVAHCGQGFLLGPAMRLDTTNHGIVSVALATGAGRHGTIFFLTDAGGGLRSQTFRLEPDGREHVYNIDMRPHRAWRGSVVGLGFQPSNDPEAWAVVRWLRMGTQPLGPPQLSIKSFAFEEVLPRSGRPVALSALVCNSGGDAAHGVRARLELIPGLRLNPGSSREQTIGSLRFGQEQRVTWLVQAAYPLRGTVRLQVSGDDAQHVAAATHVRFTRLPAVAQTGYVPEPKPVRGPYEVGAYYFPGWKPATNWARIQEYPERKPVLGWYEEGNPEVADWQIKWAVEHGITFFVYDWYWLQGNRFLEHGLHDGYFKARYHHLLKFCLLWANHNPPHSSSYEDCLAVTRYWITNYFHRPEYMKLEGKPVIIIFSPDRLTSDLGSREVRRTFEAMRDECRRAGFEGLHLVACVREAAEARLAANEGYDTISAYTWPHLGMTGPGKYAPYATVLQGYRHQWQHLAEKSPLPVWPLPVCGGWDSRPWHGENDLVRFDRTPALFERHLREARRFLETQSVKSPAPKAILIEAWNEWGEGSYIEPHAEFGFGYLDGVRKTFSKARKAHDDLTPADAALGPYDAH